ncbi:MurR/RpiR family transcriptional regulator [Eisenbergiella sp.]
MENEACLAAIRNQYNTLTRMERQIADYILENSSQVVNMNVAGLAAASGAAGSAVIRFCKTIGYPGFSRFRLALAMELASQPTPSLAVPLLSETDTSQDAARKVFASSVRTLQNTLSMLDFQVVDALVNELLSVERICLFGVGTSSPIAEDTCYRFLQLGLAASCYKDILFMPIAAMNMKKGELAIAISHSGRTQATLQALLLAKEQGATTAAITSYRTSPLAKAADYSLIAYPDDINYPVEAVSARLAHICILDALSVILTLRQGEEATAHLKTRNDILEKIRKKDEL